MASLLLCGTLSAQNGWNTDPNTHSWSGNTPIVATVQIDGVPQSDLTNLTLGAFADDELRGRANVANTSVYNGQFWIQDHTICLLLQEKPLVVYALLVLLREYMTDTAIIFLRRHCV